MIPRAPWKTILLLSNAEVGHDDADTANKEEVKNVYHS